MLLISLGLQEMDHWEGEINSSDVVKEFHCESAKSAVVEKSSLIK